MRDSWEVIVWANLLAANFLWTRQNGPRLKDRFWLKAAVGKVSWLKSALSLEVRA